MLQWLADNIEGIKAFFIVVGLISTPLVPVLVRLGWIKGATADAAVRAIETAKGAAIRAGQHFKAVHGREPTAEEIAEIIEKSIKAEAREQAIRAGSKTLLIGAKNVLGDLSDRAAAADPKGTKEKRNVVQKLGSFIRLTRGL